MKKPKDKPKDTNQHAKSIVDILTGEKPKKKKALAVKNKSTQ